MYLRALRHCSRLCVRVCRMTDAVLKCAECPISQVLVAFRSTCKGDKCMKGIKEMKERS